MLIESVSKPFPTSTFQGVRKINPKGWLIFTPCNGTISGTLRNHWLFRVPGPNLGIVSTAVFDTTKATALEQKRSKQLEDLDRVDRWPRVCFEDGKMDLFGWLLRAQGFGFLGILRKGWDVFFRKFGMFVGFSWDFHGFSCFCWWISMDFHGFSCFSWIFLDFHRFVRIFFLVIFFVTATEAVGVPPLCGDAAWLLGLLLHSWLGVPFEIFCHRSHLPWGIGFQILFGNFHTDPWGFHDPFFSNGLVKNHQLVFQKPPKAHWGERDLLSTADETLLSAEVGIMVIHENYPRTQDSSPRIMNHF